MKPEEIRKLKYVGGGYFRIPGPVGKKSPTIHGPELLELLLKYLPERDEETKPDAIETV